MDEATIREHKIRTAPDWALRSLDDLPYGQRDESYAAIWARREGIDPPPTAEELEDERIRRAELEVLNHYNLPSVLASVEWDGYFIPSRDTRALRQLVRWLWSKDERRMHMSILDLQAERIRRGLPPR